MSQTAATAASAKNAAPARELPCFAAAPVNCETVAVLVDVPGELIGAAGVLGAWGGGLRKTEVLTTGISEEAGGAGGAEGVDGAEGVEGAEGADGPDGTDGPEGADGAEGCVPAGDEGGWAPVKEEAPELGQLG